MMIARVVASVVVGVVTAQVSAVTPTPRRHLELPVLALLRDGVHLGEEDGGDEDPSCTTINMYFCSGGSLNKAGLSPTFSDILIASSRLPRLVHCALEIHLEDHGVADASFLALIIDPFRV